MEENNIEEQNQETIQNTSDNNDFQDTFHERDSLAENNIVDEVKDSFLDYSMSVITSRAIPDLRDGLKPVHRRILWSMYEEGNTPDKPHKYQLQPLVMLWVIIILMAILVSMKQW